jgi:hypothetical protein
MQLKSKQEWHELENSADPKKRDSFFVNHACETHIYMPVMDMEIRD